MYYTHTHIHIHTYIYSDSRMPALSRGGVSREGASRPKERDAQKDSAAGEGGEEGEKDIEVRDGDESDEDMVDAYFRAAVFRQV